MAFIRSRFKLSGRWLTILVALALRAAGLAFFHVRGKGRIEFATSNVTIGTIRSTVTATGALEAVRTVQVGSQVSGIIALLYADFNSTVRKGQVIAQIDASIYQAQVAQARANLDAARAQLADANARLANARANIETQSAGRASADANLASLKAQRDDARQLLRRHETLAEDGVITARELDSSRAGFLAAEARYNQAVAQLEQARVAERAASSAGLAQGQAQVRQAEAQVKQMEAALRVAEVNLAHTTITAPIDGVIVSRNVDAGQTVAASLQTPTLFTIANDLARMQVIANIDQADIGAINSANKVSFTVDAFPTQTFEGVIRQIRLNPQTAQNVVTYNVVIDVENRDLKLRPGLTANLILTTAERAGVLCAPNAALRFTPPDAAKLAAKPAPAGGRTVWVLGADRQPQPRAIITGITDGAFTEVVSGELRPGDALITGQKQPEAK